VRHRRLRFFFGVCPRCLLATECTLAGDGFGCSLTEGGSHLVCMGGHPPCQTISPAFTLHDVPPGTKQLRFVMHDEQAPSFRHGGSTIPRLVADPGRCNGSRPSRGRL
jgi:hypothetical protein